MAASCFIPRIYGWCYQARNEILRQLDAQALEGYTGSLTPTEADRLVILFLEHIAEHLELVTKVRGITSSFLSADEKKEVASRSLSGRKLTPALALKLHDASITEVGRAIVNLLGDSLEHLRKGSVNELTAEAILRRETHAASYFLFLLADRWRNEKTVLKFLLIGGEEAIGCVFEGKPTKKLLADVIHELGVRGALPRQSGIPHNAEFPFKPSSKTAEDGSIVTSESLRKAIHLSAPSPFHPDPFKERRALLITDDQIDESRACLKDIGSHPHFEKPDSIFRDQDSRRPHAPQAHGLTEVPRLTGRRKRQKG